MMTTGILMIAVKPFKFPSSTLQWFCSMMIFMMDQSLVGPRLFVEYSEDICDVLTSHHICLLIIRDQQCCDVQIQKRPFYMCRLRSVSRQLGCKATNKPVTGYSFCADPDCTATLTVLVCRRRQNPARVARTVFPRCIGCNAVLVGDRKAVCLSIRPPNACIVTKRKHLAKKVQLWLIGNRLWAFQRA